MKFLNAFGPNPRMVRMFMLEKGIELESDQIDILAAENRAEPFLRKNPAGQMPALELDDGDVLAETVAICEYLEELHPEPALVGADARQRAETRMWLRRVELNITEHLYHGFRFAEGHELFKDRVRCLPDAADGIKAKGQDGLAWLDSLIVGREWITGSHLSLADLVLYCCVDFVAHAGQPPNPDLKNINAWFKRMDVRPSATASLSPDWEAIGMRG